MSDSKNIGDFKLKIKTFGHTEIVYGNVFLNKDGGEYSAQVDDGRGKYFNAVTVRDAVLVALRDFIGNRPQAKQPNENTMIR